MRKVGQLIRDERVTLPKSVQKELVEAAKRESNLTWKELSKKFNVSETTISEVWRKGKSTIPKTHFDSLINIVHKSNKNKFYKECKVLSKNWGQIKGGKAAITRIRPINYKYSLEQMRSKIRTVQFAELIGIILGDGNINPKGVRISLEYPQELKYAQHVSKLVVSLYDFEPKINIYKRKDLRVNINSIHFAKLLRLIGFSYGSKIRNNVGIPKFIFQDDNLLCSCIRGLIDTDGGYFKKDKSGKRIIMEFKSKTNKLRTDFINGVRQLGFKTSRSGDIAIRVQNQNDVQRLYYLLGSHNPKILIKWESFNKTDKFPLTSEINNALVVQPG